jgi:hypothetical protein
MREIKQVLKLGKIKGTVVEDYPKGEERPYMIEHYGGRLVAEGLTERDANRICIAFNHYEEKKYG